MKRAHLAALVFLSVSLCLGAAQAREGFSISLGIGGGAWSLNEGSLRGSLAEMNPPRGAETGLLTNELSDGLAVRLGMAYNIKGYTSVEIGMTGHGWNLSNLDAIGGSGHVSMVAHLHPFQLFMPERDFDASVFLGGGYSILGGGHEDNNMSRGLDGGALECGIGGRYFFTNWFSLGAELRLTVPFYSRWHVDWEDGEDYDLPKGVDALFLGVLVTTSFHFVAG